jgi:hypothetical protein
MMDPHFVAQSRAAAASNSWQQPAKGKGKVAPVPGKGAGTKAKPAAPVNMSAEADAIYIAVNTATQNVRPDELLAQDGQWDMETLKRRLAKYFRAGAKGLSFSGGCKKVINEYADSVLGNVSWALQGTKWLAKADFTLVLEVAIAELFPETFKNELQEAVQFEEIILEAHDRALEEARFAPMLQDTVKDIIEGKKAQNKIYNAIEAARKTVCDKMFANTDDSSDFFAAAEHGIMGKVEEFTKGWITTSLRTFGEWPENVLERQNAQKLFDKLLNNEENCLPRSLVRYMVEPLPEPWCL